MDTLFLITLVFLGIIAACTGIVTQTVEIVERKSPTRGVAKYRETVWRVIFLPIYIYRRPY